MSVNTKHPSGTSVPAVVTRTWAKHEVLRTMDELRDFWRDYADLLGAGVEIGPLSEEKRALIEFHRGQAAGGRPIHEKMQDLQMLLGDLLEAIRQETLAFRVPTRSALLPEEHNPALSRLSQRLHRFAEPLDSIADRLVPQLTPTPDGAHPARDGAAAERAVAGEDGDLAQRAEALKAATVSLFKGVVRQDWSDVSLIIRHINLITTTSKSQGVVREVAQIAREIYNSLNEFSRDLSFEELSQATQDIPDAVVKLNSVIKRLEEFANASLDKLEQLTADALDDEQVISSALTALANCEQELEALALAEPALAEELVQVNGELRKEVRERLKNFAAHRQQSRNEYMTLISSMSFQDLSGQTLKKVIGFIEGLQGTLMSLITRHQVGAARPARPPDAVPTEGPDPGKGRAPLSQGNVDKMLADLGF